jgi:predicted kinase
MAHAAGDEFEAAPGDALTQRTFPLFFDVLRVLLAGGVTVVAEAAFQDPLWRQGLDQLLELVDLRIVHCSVSPAVAFERARRRTQRSAHADASLGQVDDWRRAFASFNRVSIPAPSIEVDTTDGYVPDLTEIVAFVNAR